MRMLLLALAATLVLAAPAAAQSTAGKLTTEHADRPLGIDETTPRFGWELTSAQRGDSQRAYRVLVGTDPSRLSPGRADVWDSGQVSSDRSYDVAYGVPALQSRTRYYWRVKAWTPDDATAWSAPSWFETGLLKASDWSARWIGAPPSANAPFVDFEG